jgi:hypothetical protein
MQPDLNMNASNNGYSITSLVFFITYTIFQIPATVIIRKIGPRIFLSAIVMFWGAVMIVSPHNSRHLPLLLTVSGFRLRPIMACHGWTAGCPWSSRGGLLSWLRLPSEYLVSALRTTETECCFLPHW